MKDESGEDLTDATNALTDLFRKVLDKKDLTVKVENLKDENVSSMVTLSEESRRMQDMMKMYGMTGMDPSMFGGQETPDPECKTSARSVHSEEWRERQHIPVLRAAV